MKFFEEIYGTGAEMSITNVNEIRKLSGLNVRQFCEKYKIPYTTYHDWDTEKSKPPVYLIELLERVVREDVEY